MNVFDFDGTVYGRDSSVDFFKFELKRRPLILRRLPLLAAKVIGYKLGKKSMEDVKSCFFAFLKDIPDVESEVKLFWKSHMKYMAEWYKTERTDSDVIISASPVFLLELPCRKLGIKKLIASDVDMKSGKFNSRNCKSAEKVSRFYEVFPDGKIDRFYSDSLSDLPMAKLAAEAFLIKNGQVTKWDTK